MNATFTTFSHYIWQTLTERTPETEQASLEVSHEETTKDEEIGVCHLDDPDLYQSTESLVTQAPTPEVSVVLNPPSSDDSLDWIGGEDEGWETYTEPYTPNLCLDSSDYFSDESSDESSDEDSEEDYEWADQAVQSPSGQSTVASVTTTNPCLRKVRFVKPPPKVYAPETEKNRKLKRSLRKDRRKGREEGHVPTRLVRESVRKSFVVNTVAFLCSKDTLSFLKKSENVYLNTFINSCVNEFV